MRDEDIRVKAACELRAIEKNCYSELFRVYCMGWKYGLFMIYNWVYGAVDFLALRVYNWLFYHIKDGNTTQFC